MDFVRRNANPIWAQDKALRKDGQVNMTRMQICEHVHFKPGLADSRWPAVHSRRD